MTDPAPSLSSILVDVELPDPEPLDPELIRALSSLRVVLLGWFAVPEQTSPAQAREQFRAEAQAALDTVAQRFEDAGADVTTRLVFTGDQLDTISRISVEENCDAVLVPAPADRVSLRRVLVPLRGLHNARRIAPFVADLVQDQTTDVTLLHVLEEDETADASRTDVLEPAAEMMRAHGIDADLLRLDARATDDPATAIVERSGEYDLVVLGETKPSVRAILFGTVPEQIVEQAQVPVIVVRHEDEEVEVAERAAQAD